jgi:tetratricopeptide (TPR) repeat protein
MGVSASLPDQEPNDSVDSFLKRVAADPIDRDLTFLSPGTHLSGRFIVERFAKRGGMGAIYRGRDSSGGDVAIKTVGRMDRDSRARFAREVSILAELSHPGIVGYLDHGTTQDGLAYLVMEWLAGEDLAERLLRAPLSLEEALALMRRVCKALSFAHARGIVHRDIKPANLFLPGSDASQVKVLDFGVARLTECDTSLTTMGTRVGTVGYMSPEQAMGEPDLDARVDVFALGCVFYECLTGRAPFASPHPVAILAKVLQEEPERPSELRPDLDARFDEFLARLLAKKRQDRPRDAQAILQAFDELTAQIGRSDPRLRRSLSPRRPDQRIVSVILGRAENAASGVAYDAGLLASLEAKFGARAAPLKGGAVLLVLSGRGEANDRASQAALCALMLSEARPELTLAVSTGLVDTSGGVPVGIAIDRAASLLSEAVGLRGVMLDEVTVGLIGLRFEVQKLEGRNLLLAARRDFDAPRQLMGRPTPYVGRDREIRTLDEALNECMLESVARVVLITGPPGIGKSRLASEWLARGGRGGIVRTLFSRVDPSSAGSAWSMVQLLIRDAASLREADPRDVQLCKLSQHLRQLLGEGATQTLEFLTEVLGFREPEPSALLQAARGNPDVMREQVRRALHAWLDAEAAGQPILLVLEDLHWGDSPSLAFLVEAMRERPDRPLMVLALARPEVERQFPEFCERAVMHVRLPGLGARAVQQLIEAALGGEVDAGTMARLIRVADGNPFYLEELMRSVAVGGGEWPGTVIAMAQSRIDRLEPAARCLLRAASVFGERCWDRGVAEILDENVDVPGLLDQLLAEELLLEVPDSRYGAAREYRFRHALLRDAAYAMMTHEERCAAHGVAGDWLERNHEKDERLLADHYEAAELRDRARPWLMRAAKRAIDAGDLPSTIELADRGVGLSPGGQERGRFLLMRCYADALRGDADLEKAREALDLLSVGTSLWWLGLGVLIFCSCMQGRPEEAAPYVSLAREATFTRDPDVPLGQVLVTLVGMLVLLGKASVAEGILERVRKLGSGAQADPVFEAFLSASQCALEAVAPVGGRWHLERALREGRRSADTLGELGAFHGQSIVLYYTAVAAMHVGLYAEARDACARSCELARKAGAGIRDPWPYLFLAKAHLRLGEPAEALKAIEPIATCPDRTARQMLPIIVAEALLRQGKLQAAEAEVSAACSGTSPRLQRLAACVLARAQLSRGQITEALRTIELALESATSSGLESEIDLMNLRAECLLACGQREAASRVAARTRDLVLRLADEIDDAALRRSFLGNVEPCARALSLSEQLA